jgi:hypothetical protein
MPLEFTLCDVLCPWLAPICSLSPLRLTSWKCSYLFLEEGWASVCAQRRGPLASVACALRCPRRTQGNISDRNVGDSAL